MTHAIAANAATLAIHRPKNQNRRLTSGRGSLIDQAGEGAPVLVASKR